MSRVAVWIVLCQWPRRGPTPDKLPPAAHDSRRHFTRLFRDSAGSASGDGCCNSSRRARRFKSKRKTGLKDLLIGYMESPDFARALDLFARSQDEFDVKRNYDPHGVFRSGPAGSLLGAEFRTGLRTNS